MRQRWGTASDKLDLGLGDDHAVPVEFEVSQQLYEQWQSGKLTADDIRARYGRATMELLESQHIVMGSSSVDNVAQCASGLGLGGTSDTLLDTMLATCRSEDMVNNRSWDVEKNGSYEDVNGSWSEGCRSLRAAETEGNKGGKGSE